MKSVEQKIEENVRVQALKEWKSQGDGVSPRSSEDALKIAARTQTQRALRRLLPSVSEGTVNMYVDKLFTGDVAEDIFAELAFQEIGERAEKAQDKLIQTIMGD